MHLADSPSVHRSPTVTPSQSPRLPALAVPGLLPTLILSSPLRIAAEQIRKRGRDETEGVAEGNTKDTADGGGEVAGSEINAGGDEGPSSAKRQKVNNPTALTNTRSSTLSSTSQALPLNPTFTPSSQLVVWTHLYPLAASSAPGAVIDVPHDAPKWLSRAVRLLDINLGPSWIKTVELWYAREESFDFLDKGRFPDKEKSRPDAVAKWQKNDRNPLWRPGSLQLETYSKQFWDWWLAIQPKRRVNERTRRSTRDEALLDKGAFNIHGGLGMLQVIAALFFWGNAIVEDRKAGGHAGEDGSWAEAVEDVFWVMGKL